LQKYWLPALEKGQLTFGGKENRRAYILQSAGLTGKVGPLISLLLDNKVTAANLDSTLAAISQDADEEQLFKLQRSNFDSTTLAKVYAAITRAVRERKLGFKPDNNELREKLLGGATEQIVAEAARLAGATKNDYVRKHVADLAETTRSAPVRRGAMDGLAYYGGGDEIALLQKLAGAEKDPATRLAAAETLTLIDVRFAAITAADVLSAPLAGADPAPLFQAFLARNGGAAALGNTLLVRKPGADAAKIGLRTVQAAGRQEETLNKVLSEAAGLDAEIKPLSKAELAQWLAEVQEKGDPARGERIFRRPELSCYGCHAVNNAGGQVGPDLSAVGTGSTVEYLLESLLFPSKIVKDGFETVEVTTVDDDYILGVRVRESKNELVLKDATRPEIVIPAKSIKERKDKPVSIMPNGLANGLTHAELLDLLRFLSELGKPGPYANNPQPVLRRWRTIGSESIESQSSSTSSGSSTWSQTSANAVYSLVSGLLPLEALGSSPDGTSARVRTEIEVTTPGKILLRLNSIEGLSLGVGAKMIPLKPETILDLPRGMHNLTFLIDLRKRREGLKVELDEVPGSPGRAQVLAGR
jgi:putative heme-binding domain-containing protein